MPKYQALTNLSVPRAGDTTGQNDLVPAGETAELTEEVAAHFLGTCGCAQHRMRRQRPVIRKAVEAKQPLVLATAKTMSGPLRGAPADARPDPAGSSRVIINETIPEGNEPAADLEGGADQDAIDLPPGTRIRAGV